MDAKEIANRLEIIKLAIPINDKDTINIQSNFLKNSKDIYLKEIAKLLEGKNYRQALYIIKKYMDESEVLINSNFSDNDKEKEQVLNVEDMLKMSPIGKETINEFKKSNYTKDDLEAFAKNIKEKSTINEEKIETSYKIKNPQEVASNNNQDIKATNTIIKAQKAINQASIDTPLDEMGKELDNKHRKKVLSKYKTLRSKFAKNKVNEKEEKNEHIQENIYKDEIYPPIPHIENKFRQLFSIYHPLKEHDIWMEEVAKFIKFISSNSYKDSDVELFLENFFKYKESKDIAKAAQILLLASSTDTKYSKFILARELFKGEVLKRDIKNSLQIMTSLANSGYADAICDLGQFYEYGIGVEENKKIALKLYEKAFELGLQRATKHIDRIKESSSVFSIIKKVFK